MSKNKIFDDIFIWSENEIRSIRFNYTLMSLIVH